MAEERKLICVNKTCSKKGRAQKEENFYNSRVEGMDKYPLCKSCIKDMLMLPDKKDVLTQALKLLRAMNYPFYKEVWDKAEEMSPTNTFGTYVSKIGSLAQYKGKTWEDGEGGENNADTREPEEELGEQQEEDDYEPLEAGERKRLVSLFGRGYNDGDLIAMRDKYNLLKEGYPDTPLHREALTNYVKYRVQEEDCTANGDPEGAEMWSKLAQKQADIAKLNPKQLAEKDLNEGLNAVSTLSLLVEKNIDIIPTMPYYVYQPKDLPDFILYCLIEHLREEKGLPSVSYREIYEWYDKKLATWKAIQGDPEGALHDSDLMQRKIAEKFLRDAQFEEGDGK